MTVTIDDQGWIKEAEGIYYPRLTFGPFSDTPNFIVLHGTATANATAQDIATYWSQQSANGTGDASAHIIIDKSGLYVQGLSLLNVSWANSGAQNSPRANYLPAYPANLNFVTRAAIEHCKYDPSQNSDILTDAQKQTSFTVIQAICEKYGIPKKVVYVDDVSSGGIIDHKSCDETNRAFCPGPYPWQDLANFLHGGPAMFTDDLCIRVWNSTFSVMGQTPSQRDTGIFNEWRAQWRNGHFKGAPHGGEYPIQGGVAQNFLGGTCTWINGKPEWL